MTIRARNRSTPGGRAIGATLAAWCDEAEPKARLKSPDLPPRCASCAFRAGPHVANGSPETLTAAVACLVKGDEFQCHEPGRAGQPCSGWLMMKLAEETD